MQLAPVSPPIGQSNAPLPPGQNVDAIMGEIFATLVVTTTLSAELKELEDHAAAVAADEQLSRQLLAERSEAEAMRAENACEAAQEALALLANERGLRQAAQTKLRYLHAERSSDAGLQQRIDEQQKQLHLRDRELREARTKAQQMLDRHAAANHGLRVERQNARGQRRTFGARSVVQLAHELWVVERLRRGLLTWRAKVVDAGIFELGHAHAAQPPPQQPQPTAPQWGHDGAPTALPSHARRPRREDDELALSAHIDLLAARDAENRALRAGRCAR